MQLQLRVIGFLVKGELIGDRVEFMLVADIVCRQVAPSCHSGSAHPLDASYLLHNKETELSWAKVVNTEDKVRRYIAPNIPQRN